MKFEECKVGMVIESAIGNHYEILGINEGAMTVDLKCIYVSVGGGVGIIHSNWSAPLKEWKIVSHDSSFKSLKLALNEETTLRIKAESAYAKITDMMVKQTSELHSIRQELKAVTLERDKAQAELYRLTLEK